MPIGAVKRNKRMRALETELVKGRVDLTVAAEAGNAIVVTGAIKDQGGVARTTQPMVRVTTHAPTAAKGVITTTAGTQKTNETVTTKTNVATILPTAGGAFAVSVADDQVEAVQIIIEVDGCPPVSRQLVFT